jgi:arginyl-tRNA synthetase
MTIKNRLLILLQGRYPDDEIRIDAVPRDKEGDYSTNLALKTASRTGTAPMVQAEKIAAEIRDPMIDRATVYPPGFVNFTIRRNFFLDCLRKEDFTLSTGGGERILIEFVSANPTGPINIVSARAAVFGDTLVKILRATAYDVQAEYYVNDSGRQIELLATSVEQRMRELAGEPMQLPDEGYHGTYLIAVAEQAVERKLTQHDDIKKFVLEYFIDNHRSTLESFGVRFDHWQRESQVRESGAVENVLQILKDKKLTFEQDGALYFRSTDFQDPRDRVIVTRDGRYTYLLPDIAYHRNKISRGYEHLITVLGPDHIGQVPSLIGGIQACGHPRDILKVIIVQEVKLKKDGKILSMSKRAGTFTALSELLEKIPVDVARFFFLMRSCSQHLDFDLDLAMKDSEENPVYYVQYAHARIKSILVFARDKNILLLDDTDVNLDRLSEKEEQVLIKDILRLPEVVEDVTRSLDPYFLTYYLIDLARDFHCFYNQHRVVCEDPGLTQARLYLIRRTADALKKGCDLMGISCPDKM